MFCFSSSRCLCAHVPLLLAVLLMTTAQPSRAQSIPDLGERVLYGRQALMTCNGLFVSNRTLDQLYAQELKLYDLPFLPQDQLAVDRARQTVRVGRGADGPVMHAAYRNGLGCIILGPEQSLDNLDTLPKRSSRTPMPDVAALPWPSGDQTSNAPLLAYIDAEALDDAADYVFEREAHGGHASQTTTGFLVVHQGQIIYERYAPGFDYTTKTRMWSSAKSLSSTLVGLLVSRGQLSLDDPLPVYQDPDDPRHAITLRDALHMASGLEPVDNSGCHAGASCMSYYAGSSALAGAQNRTLVAQPGTAWDYENYDTILAYAATKAVFPTTDDYLAFPHRALFEKIGMHHTIPGVDRFGDYIMSSQVYSNARDLARLGLLYLNEGVWNGERLLTEAWIDFVRTPAPATADRGGIYGGQWWLVASDRTDVPADAFAANGNRGQYLIIVPSYDLVIVRRGLDALPNQYRLSPWAITQEVLQAFTQEP